MNPCLLSYLILCELDGVSEFIKKFFGIDTYTECKVLNLTANSKENLLASNIFRYNLIGLFVNLEELIISNDKINFYELDVVKDNVKKLEFLHTIKFTCKNSLGFDLTFF